ncbi:MAG: hypothetical protein JXA17_01060 [Dehalococcoidales bacterium]|nr:hypothetical protein [Dehalococcoidales bacterium]
MKGFKFSKTGLLILATGAFIVVLAGLGVTRFSQTSEQDSLNEALAISETRLDLMNLQPLQVQMAELEEQLDESEILLAEAKLRLVQSVISVNVTDKFYEIAAYHGIIVDTISTTKNQAQDYTGVPCTMITINAMVTGDLEHVIDFIAGLNNNFTTGFVQSAQIAIEDEEDESGTISNITMIVYTYEGN